MRLEPIENPRHPITRLVYWMARRRLGKVMTPMKVVYARIPKIFRLVYEEVKLVEKGLSVDPVINLLVRTWVAMINECSFCVDIAKATALQRRMTLDKLDALSEYRTSPLYGDRERAALAYVEEATRHKRVSDATFETLRRHFTDTEIAEITWLCALENYYNLINLPLEIESDGLCAIARRRAAA
jgi:alkylhydroperoxidase family enzyme